MYNTLTLYNHVILLYFHFLSKILSLPHIKLQKIAIDIKCKESTTRKKFNFKIYKTVHRNRRHIYEYEYIIVHSKITKCRAGRGHASEFLRHHVKGQTNGWTVLAVNTDAADPPGTGYPVLG